MRFVTFFILVLISTVSFGADLFSITDGNWTSGATWSYTSGGASCGCTPSASDSVTVETDVVLNKKLTGGSGITGSLVITTGSSLIGVTRNVEIKAGGSFYLYGNLEVQDLTLSNGSVLMSSNSTIVVNGDFSNKNNSDDVVIDGSVDVAGDFYNGNGGIISGSGVIEVDGVYTNTGNTFGCVGVDCCNGTPCIYNEFEPIMSIATGDFNSTTTWNCTCVPDVDNKIIIDQGHTVTLVGNIEVAGIDIDTTGVLETSTHAVTVNETDLWNAGSFSGATGGLTMSSTSGAQTITNESTFDVSVLTINNSNGILLTGSSVSVHDLVTISSGTLTTGGILVLKSDAARTAAIGDLSSGGISGNVTAERFVAAGTRAWWHMSSPINGMLATDWMDDFSITGNYTGSPDLGGSNNASVYWYDEIHADPSIDSGWVPFPTASASEVVTTGRGYRAFLRVDASTSIGDVTIDMTGVINNGNVNLPVTYNDAGGATAAGWCFVGNPYPSTIDWDAGAWTKTAVNDAIYIWKGSGGSYASYVNGAATNGGSSLIAQGQGFWVRTSANSPFLTVQESCKSNTGVSFFKTAGLPGDQVSITIKDGEDQANTILRFNESATDAFDSDWDAEYLGGSHPVNITSYKSDYSEWYAINSKPSNEDHYVPIWVIHPSVEKDYVLSIDIGADLAAAGSVILNDNYTGEETVITGPMDYSFEYDGSWSSNGGSRFEVIYRVSEVTDVDEEDAESRLELYPNPVKSGSSVYFSQEISSEYKLYDANGYIVDEGYLNGSSLTVPTHLNQGVYHVSILESGLVKPIVVE